MRTSIAWVLLLGLVPVLDSKRFPVGVVYTYPFQKFESCRFSSLNSNPCLNPSTCNLGEDYEVEVEKPNEERSSTCKN